MIKIGNSPAEAGLFRAGTIDSKYEIAPVWLGHPVFTEKEEQEFTVPRNLTSLKDSPLFFLRLKENCPC